MSDKQIPIVDIANDLIKRYTKEGEESRIIYERTTGAILGIQDLIKAIEQYQINLNKDSESDEKTAE